MNGCIVHSVAGIRQLRHDPKSDGSRGNPFPELVEKEIGGLGGDYRRVQVLVTRGRDDPISAEPRGSIFVGEVERRHSEVRLRAKLDGAGLGVCTNFSAAG